MTAGSSSAPRPGVTAFISPPDARGTAALRVKAERPIVYPLNRDECLALVDLAEAAELVSAYHQAGGQGWWDAHSRLYEALTALGVDVPWTLETGTPRHPPLTGQMLLDQQLRQADEDEEDYRADGSLR